jgi:hypothetical protein
MTGKMPEMVLRVEVLPAPLAPIKATISPDFTSKETSFKALIAPYLSEICLILSISE